MPSIQECKPKWSSSSTGTCLVCMVYIGCILDLVVVYLHVIPFSCLEDGLETVLDHVTFILPFCLYLMILSIPKRHCFRVICCDCVTTIFESFLHFPTQRLKGHFCELQIHRYMMTSYHIHVVSPCLTEHDRCFTIAKRKRWPSHPPGLVVRTSQKHLNVPMVTPSDDGRSRGSSSKRFHCRGPQIPSWKMQICCPPEL